MPKNIVRRAFAVGSIVALGTAALVAAPAQAVEPLSISLNSGTSFNSVTGYTNELTLNTSISSAYAGTADEKLVYRIGNAGLADVQVAFGYAATTEATLDGTMAKAYAYGLAPELADSDASNKTFNEADVVVDLLTTALGDYAKPNLLSVGVKDATETNYTVTVQAWLDNNGNNVIDSTEVVSNVVTLNFYDETNVTASSAVKSSVVGANQVVVETTTVPSLNGDQLGTNFINANVTAQGNANSVFASATWASNGTTAGSTTWSDTTSTWTSTAYLAYSNPADRWTGTDSAVVDVNLGVDLNGQPWWFQTAGTTTAGYLILDADGAGAGGVAHSLTAATGVTHYLTFGVQKSTAVAVANAEFLLPVASVSFTAAADSGVVGSQIGFTKTVTAEASPGVELTAGTLRALVAAPQATVTAGTYSADAYIGTTTKLVAATASGVAAVTASDVMGAIAGSTNNTGGLNSTSTATAISVRSAFTGDIPVTASIYTSTGATVAAGVSVQVTADSFTGTLVYVNGTKITTAGQVVNLTTDASGKVAFNVKSTNALETDALSITISAEGTTGDDDSQFALTWDTATYALYDLKDLQMTTSNINLARTIDAGGSYTFNLALVDQWGGYLAANTYRYEVATTGNTAGTTTHVLDADGVTEVTISDQGLVGGAGSITVDIDVEKLVSGAWTTSEAIAVTASEFEEWASGTGRHTITVVTAQTESVSLNTTGSSSLGGSNADFDGAISTTALAAVDNRLSVDDYSTGGSTNVSGVVRNATTLAAVAGAEVTVSGPSDYFFKVGGKIAQGSLTFVASSSGVFNVVVYSNKATADQVVTVSSNGASSTVKVKFTGSAAANAGTSIVIDAPTYVLPASTLSFTSTVFDVFGNAVDSDQSSGAAAGAASVDAGDATYSIAYTGPGLIVGTTPSAIKESSVLGDKFNILLGANDSGTITITVSYDQNGDKDFTDAKDLVVTKTITIGAAPVVSETKITVGTYKGYVAVFAKGYEGQKLSVRLASKWHVVAALADLKAGYALKTINTGVGYEANVIVYIDGVEVQRKTITTK